MTRIKHHLSALLCALIVASGNAPAANAQNYDDVLRASLLTGWRQSDGTHMAGIRLQLKPGWHTYWRAPGDVGIPPIFDLDGSGNFKDAQVIWPRPEIYKQDGARSIVYHDQVILPLQVMPRRKGGDIDLKARIEIGVCSDICIPRTLNIAALLPANGGKRDARIAASLAERAYTGKEAGVANMRCQISPTRDGVSLSTSFTMSPTGRGEAMIVEAANPLLWVAVPKMVRRGNQVTATTQIAHVDGAPFLLNRSRLRITMLSENQAVEISGCKG